MAAEVWPDLLVGCEVACTAAKVRSGRGTGVGAVLPDRRIERIFKGR